MRHYVSNIRYKFSLDTLYISRVRRRKLAGLTVVIDHRVLKFSLYFIRKTPYTDLDEIWHGGRLLDIIHRDNFFEIY